MPTLLLFPILPFLLEVALVFWWVFVAAYLYSSGKLLLLKHRVLTYLEKADVTAVLTSSPAHPCKHHTST